MTTSPWNLSAPHRPTTDDLVCDLVDDTEFPPDPTTQPSAAGWNQRGLCNVASGRVVAAAKVTVRFTAGTPGVYAVTSCRGDLTGPDFTLVDNGAGDTTITWSATAFPAPVADATAAATGATPVLVAVERLSAYSCRVRTLDAAGVATDAGFVLTID